MIIIKNNELFILKCIKRNHSLSVLTGIGMSYSQIASAIQKLINEGYAEYDENDVIQVTDAGMKEIDKYNRKNTDKQQQWIFPQYQKYSKPLDQSVIILPKRKKL